MALRVRILPPASRRSVSCLASNPFPSAPSIRCFARVSPFFAFLATTIRAAPQSSRRKETLQPKRRYASKEGLEGGLRKKKGEKSLGDSWRSTERQFLPLDSPPGVRKASKNHGGTKPALEWDIHATPVGHLDRPYRKIEGTNAELPPSELLHAAPSLFHGVYLPSSEEEVLRDVFRCNPGGERAAASNEQPGNHSPITAGVMDRLSPCPGAQPSRLAGGWPGRYSSSHQPAAGQTSRAFSTPAALVSPPGRQRLPAIAAGKAAGTAGAPSRELHERRDSEWVGQGGRGAVEPFHSWWGHKGKEAWTMGVGTGAMYKIHEAWERGTWGGEKLGKWARKKLQQGFGWRAKAAVREFELWEEESLKGELRRFEEEFNLVWDKRKTRGRPPGENLPPDASVAAPQPGLAGGLQGGPSGVRGWSEGGSTPPPEGGEDDSGWDYDVEPTHKVRRIRGVDMDRGAFARSYDVYGLRIPADKCSLLAARLGALLLNWPRVKNVVRVPGDDEGIKENEAAAVETAEQESVATEAAKTQKSAEKRVRKRGPRTEAGPIPGRSGQGGSATGKGPQLARGDGDGIVAPDDEGAGSGERASGGLGKGVTCLVMGQVAHRASADPLLSSGLQDTLLPGCPPGWRAEGFREGDGARVGQDGSMRGTRVLLLSHGFAGVAPEGLPDAIKAVVGLCGSSTAQDPGLPLPGPLAAAAAPEDASGHPGGGEPERGEGALGADTGGGVGGVPGGPKWERVGGSSLVRCRVTLDYDYWAADEVLRFCLPPEVPVPTSFEVVGHIAHLNLLDAHLPHRHLIAQVILDKHKPRILSVVNKTGAIHSKYRTMKLELLAGSFNLVTTVQENDIPFKVDFSRVYWNTRLGTERQRLVSQFGPKDVICDVFAGVGPISVAAAKRGVKRVYANDLNPSAITFLAENVIANGVVSRVELFNLDGREFLRHLLALQRPVQMTQIVMNLPQDAIEFLDALKGAFPREKWGTRLPLPMVHVYGFSKAPDPEHELTQRIEATLGSGSMHISFHRVRLVAPGKWMLCCSFRLPAEVVFDVW